MVFIFSWIAKEMMNGHGQRDYKNCFQGGVCYNSTTNYVKICKKIISYCKVSFILKQQLFNGGHSHKNDECMNYCNHGESFLIK